MRITLLYFLLFAATVASAQDTAGRSIKDTTIIRDTINLRGYIYQSDGKPLKYEVIESSYLQADYRDYKNIKLATRTDTNGYFELKGARPNDTLTLESNKFYGIGPYYNKGSRYMVMYLPPLKTFEITADTPIVISKKRLSPKAKAMYHPQPTDIHMHWLPCCFTPVPSDGAYKRMKIDDFIDSVKAHINYPVTAIINNIEGTVTIRFTVEKDGSLAYFKVLQGIGYGCDEEVINAIKRMPKWIPGVDKGRIVGAIDQTLSVVFKLTEK